MVPEYDLFSDSAGNFRRAISHLPYQPRTLQKKVKVFLMELF
jgi:hypothetical protein